MTAQKPLRNLAAVSDLSSRVHAVGDRVERLGPVGFVAALDVLARDAARGTTVADCSAMLACALWLSSAAGRIAADTLGAAAAGAAHGTHAIARAMLDDVPAHKQLSRHGRLPDSGGPNRVERYRKHWAPTESAVWAYLDAQLLRSHPADEQYLPAALRLVTDERDVVNIAARRPTTAPIVAELLAHLGWMARPSVRFALVENPFTPTRVALLLLPTCSSRLRSLAKANVHPRLRELAALLAT